MPELDHANQPRRRFAGARRRRLLFVLAIALVAVTVTFRNTLFHGNFGVVEPGRVYRSAQPGDDLPAIVDRFGMASILNLRGGTPADRFYAQEVELSRRRGLDFYDFPMSATRAPSRRELLILLDLFERCRYPLLIHCKSGSDRTGLVSGLYLLAKAGKPPSEALRSFSIYYGHIPLLGTARLHAPFVEYERWLLRRRLDHSPSRLRAWVESEYEAEPAPAVVPVLPAGPRFARAGRFPH